MNCERARELAAERLGGELAGPDIGALADHLGACPACRDHFAALASARDKIVSLVPTAAESEGAVAALRLGRAAHAAPGRPTGGPRRMRSSTIRLWPTLRLAAMLAIAFALGFFARSQAGHAGAPQPTATAVPVPAPSTRLEATYAGAAQRFPGRSTLAWGMLSLARR